MDITPASTTDAALTPEEEQIVREGLAKLHGLQDKPRVSKELQERVNTALGTPSPSGRSDDAEDPLL